jgi:hypothetical protein
MYTCRVDCVKGQVAFLVALLGIVPVQLYICTVCTPAQLTVCEVKHTARPAARHAAQVSVVLVALLTHLSVVPTWLGRIEQLGANRPQGHYFACCACIWTQVQHAAQDMCYWHPPTHPPTHPPIPHPPTHPPTHSIAETIRRKHPLVKQPQDAFQVGHASPLSC